MSRTVTAKWIFPVSAPPLEGGTVTVRDGVIESVDAAGVRKADVDLGEVGILPGLVNAHTHLDLSGAGTLPRPTPGTSFPDWLRGVIAFRRTRTPAETLADIRHGIAELERTGTVLVGDISAGGTSWDALAESAIHAVVFFEMIGLKEDRATAAAAAAGAWLRDHPDTPTCRAGLSPHAPYTARGSLIAAAGRLAAARTPKAPTAMHLAESAAETDLVFHRRGPFVPFLEGVSAWDPAGPVTDYASAMTAIDFRQPKLFIHANELHPNARIPRGSTIVYCPRTHATFGHSPHSFRKFLKLGHRVCLATDGLASNPDLDVFAEAQFVRDRHPTLPGDDLLKMITLWPAEALGWGEELGSLAPGKRADMIAMPLAAGERDPHDAVFGGRGGRVLVSGAA